MVTAPTGVNQVVNNCYLLTYTKPQQKTIGFVLILDEEVLNMLSRRLNGDLLLNGKDVSSGPEADNNKARKVEGREWASAFT